MKLFLECLKPDFLQAMIVITLFYLLPLKKKSHWKIKYLILAILMMCVEIPLTNLTVKGWEQPGAFIIPVIFPFFAFLFCTESEIWESLYGLACVYASQHVAYCAVTILWTNGKLWYQSILAWIVHMIIFIFIWKYVAVKLPYKGKYLVTKRKVLLVSGLVFFIALFLSYSSRHQGIDIENTKAYTIYMASDLLSCLFILLIQVEQRRETTLLQSIETERSLRQQMKLQYELSKENIDIINRKSHDLKHQISALRFIQNREELDAGLRDVEEAVQIYDSSAQTKNDALNVLLTEKGLICRENGILWSHMADGENLDFISPLDLYTMLGNALDNAIESCRKIKNPEKKVIRVSVRQSHGMIFFQIENYFEQQLKFVDGLPQTTKEDVQNHGFGMQSIRFITERYGGTMDIETNDDVFLLTILIPKPAATTNMR